MMTRFTLVLVLIIGSVCGAMASPGATGAGDEAPVVRPTGTGVRITWRPTVPDPALPATPVLVALRAHGDAGIEPRVIALDDVLWSGAPDDVPVTPVIVLREARQRGERIVTLALSPVYRQDSGVRAVRTLEVLVEAVAPLDPAGETALAFAQAAAPASIPPRPPAFPAAPALRVRVEHEGLQILRVGDLNAAIAASPARIKLSRAGTEIPVELRDVNGNNVWGDPEDELRFYAPPPGDRWNQSDTYWLTLEDGARLRITSRTVSAPAAGSPATAYERKVLRGIALYDSRRPGSDGDHWFAALLRAESGQPEDEQARMSIPLTTTLPAAAGTMTFTVSVHVQYGAVRRLTAAVGSSSSAPVEWSSAGDATLTLVAPGTVGSVTAAHLTLTAITGYAQVAVDAVEWYRPVLLQFGGKGAIFQGASGQRAYQIAGAPPGFDLYDVTDPAAPVRVQITGFSFEDDLPGRSYLLTGDGTVFTPTVEPFTPPALPSGADAVYIAPALLHSVLTPLIDLRRAQGYTVVVIDVQSIYDGWSSGQVDPRAIRSFLQHAVRTWSPSPMAVTLVGDGSSDPFDYTGRGAKNVNLIPPYLAMVDPWLGETACETCYAQLDGENPADDRLPDVWLGRLPVKSASELQTLVAKIVGYEIAPIGGAWRGRMLYLADDADSSGDFAAQAEASIALQPPGVQIERVFFGNGAGQIPTAAAARAAALARFNDGAAIVAYFGHAHQQQWAVTELSASENWLLHRSDVLHLTNGDRLPVVLSLTCLSSAFQWPSYIGMTIDEALLLSEKGGAVAVWGPTGLGVSYGHDKLQQGFFHALWSSSERNDIEYAVPLGALTTAGLRELFTTSACCQETLLTYAFLGDPLTRLRVVSTWRVMLPLVRR
ncbi:MAG: C25 family cysteine peptidase [Roseiflexus sp.]